jgi:PTH1 family peptidyl-tRNA hydrolase
VGKKYAGTRHNLGFALLDRLSAEWKISPSPGRGDYYLAEYKFRNRQARLFWPTTYMNNSGVAVAQIVDYFSTDISNILIAYDDLYLDLGRIRIRQQGSDGGHNGMSSVIDHLGTEKIARLRLGTGPLPPHSDQVTFALGKLNAEELKIREKMLDKAKEAILYSLSNRLDEAMKIYNYNPAPESE